jgi:putative serine protease PepD
MRASNLERNGMNRSSRIPMIALILVATLVLGAGAGAVAYSTFGPTPTKTVVRQVPVASSEPAAESSAFTPAQIYQRAYRGVVEITVDSTQQNPFGSQEQRSQGSGFVIDSKGHIVTNEHVVDGANSVSVRFWNDTVYKATVVGTDPSTDLAVIKVDAPASALHPLSFGDSDALRVGDTAFALGSPFGLEETFTSGIVSALHRQMEAPNNFTINDSIQTDAAINHGNSGGPLLNARGGVIGVNSQIRSDSGGSDGVGFAIPSNTVRSIADTLIGSGKVEHAYLGVSVQQIPGTVADQLKLVAGVEIADVRSKTPAEKAGLKGATGKKTIDGELYPTGGDVITAIDGKKITSSENVQQTIDAHKPGDTVSVTYWRNGDSHTVDVKLATRPTTIPQQ